MYSEEKIQEFKTKVIESLSEGHTLREICRFIDMPSYGLVYQWKKSDPVFEQAFNEARDIGFDAIADDCMGIADNVNGDPQRDKLRVYTRLQLLAKWSSRYQDNSKQNIQHLDDKGQPTNPPMMESAVLDAINRKHSDS